MVLQSIALESGRIGRTLCSAVGINRATEVAMALATWRQKLRKSREYEDADALRTIIQNMGFEVCDSETSTTIRARR